LRSVLHYEAARRGERSRAVRLLRHRHRAGRHSSGRELQRRGGLVHRRAAARGARLLKIRLAPALLLALLTTSCAGVGAPVPGAPAHHRERGFANVNPSHEAAGGWTRFTFFISRIWASTFSPRTANLPSIASDLAAILDNRGPPTSTSSTGGTAARSAGSRSRACRPSTSRAARSGIATVASGAAGSSPAEPNARTSPGTRATSTGSRRSASGSARSISPRYRSARTCRRSS